ncbi:MAG: hypothetical protein DRJ64_01535 [Thermoprotei archaeon]|nr:MAG: hypothetical protein DRJ64_01535 [Thermoprotei archaeon]
MANALKFDVNKLVASLLALAYATAPQDFEDMDFTPKNEPAKLPASSQIPPDVLGGVLTKAVHDIDMPVSIIQVAQMYGLPVPDALKPVAEELGYADTTSNG